MKVKEQGLTKEQRQLTEQIKGRKGLTQASKDALIKAIKTAPSPEEQYQKQESLAKKYGFDLWLSASEEVGLRHLSDQEQKEFRELCYKILHSTPKEWKGSPGARRYIELSEKIQKAMTPEDWERVREQEKKRECSNKEFTGWVGQEIEKLRVDVQRLRKEKRKAERLIPGERAPVRVHIPTGAQRLFSWMFEPDRLSKKDLVEQSIGKDGQELWTYRKEKRDWVTEYITVKSVIGGEAPPLREMERAFFSSVFLAVQQKTWTPLFTIGEKMKIQEHSAAQIKGGGRVFSDKERAEKALVATTYHRFNKKRGKAYRESIGQLYSNLEIYGRGKGALYEATINDKLFPGLNIETGRVDQGSFVTIPQRHITDKSSGLYERRFVSYLLPLKGLSIPLTGARILKEAGVPRAYLNRSGFCVDIVLRCLAAAKKEGFTYKGIKALPKDIKKWTITLYSLKKKARQLTEAGRELAQEIAEWQSRPIFKPKLSRTEYQKRWENMIRKKGVEPIRELFKEEINSLNPFPGNLWKKAIALPNTDTR